MIRINLLPVRERRRKREGRQLLFLFILLLVGQIMALYYFHGELSAEQARVTGQLRTVDAEIQKRQSVRQRIEELEGRRANLASQVELFEKLKQEKQGPANLLLYLAYVLSPQSENPYNRDELRVQERIAWDTNWNPNRVWLRKITQAKDELLLQGTAMGHEDVSEFATRLRTGVFFPDVQPMTQVASIDREFKLTTVEFRLESGVRFYDPDRIGGGE